MKVSVFFDGQNFYRSLQRYDESLRVDYDRLAAWITQAAGGPGAIFAGTALRCDFVGRMLAGFWLDRPHTTPGRPRGGSAWFASVQPGAPPLPVRMSFKTDWFGDVTMVLTAATPQAPDLVQAASSPR